MVPVIGKFFMSGEQRFHREEGRTFSKAQFDMAIVILFCALGLVLSLAVFPKHDTWTPNQMLTSP
jgi:hypothetical protein